MPSKSKAQHRLMAAAAQGKVPGIKPSVGREYIHADKGKMAKKPEHKPKSHKR